MNSPTVWHNSAVKLSSILYILFGWFWKVHHYALPIVADVAKCLIYLADASVDDVGLKFVLQLCPAVHFSASMHKLDRMVNVQMTPWWCTAGVSTFERCQLKHQSNILSSKWSEPQMGLWFLAVMIWIKRKHLIPNLKPTELVASHAWLPGKQSGRCFSFLKCGLLQAVEEGKMQRTAAEKLLYCLCSWEESEPQEATSAPWLPRQQNSDGLVTVITDTVWEKGNCSSLL